MTEDRLITEADWAAVRKLRESVGPKRKPNHAKMAGLVGADVCPHELAGNGKPNSEVMGGSLREYTSTPYRHHVYVLTEGTSRDNFNYCKCGNSLGGFVHELCDEAAEAARALGVNSNV
jgi:hypothetical protein